MLSREEVVELAEEYASKGFLCSEAVLMAISRCLGVRSGMIPKIATGFGAGVGRKGEVYGALSGAVMGLGLRFGRSRFEEQEGGRRPYWFASELVERFRARLGQARCGDLLGLDLSDPKGLQAYREAGMWEKRCRGIISEAAGLAHDLLSRHGEEQAGKV